MQAYPAAQPCLRDRVGYKFNITLSFAVSAAYVNPSVPFQFFTKYVPTLTVANCSSSGSDSFEACSQQNLGTVL